MSAPEIPAPEATILPQEPVAEEPVVPAEQRFEHDGQEWIARLAGEGAAGTGSRGPAPIQAVHFYRPDEERPRFEALLPYGLLPNLFAAELAALLRAATPVPPAS